MTSAAEWYKNRIGGEPTERWIREIQADALSAASEECEEAHRNCRAVESTSKDRPTCHVVDSLKIQDLMRLHLNQGAAMTTIHPTLSEAQDEINSDHARELVPEPRPVTRRDHSEILSQIERVAWDARWLCEPEIPGHTLGFGDLTPGVRKAKTELLLELVRELSRG